MVTTSGKSAYFFIITICNDVTHIFVVHDSTMR